MPNADPAANKTLALKALTGIFNDRDYTLFDTLFAVDYIQHNPLVQTGRAGVKAFAESLPTTLRYEPGIAVAEGDFVMIHGRYTGWSAKAILGVDIFRIANGQLVEHWDTLQEEVPTTATASGNPHFTIPTF